MFGYYNTKIACEQWRLFGKLTEKFSTLAQNLCLKNL